MVSYRTAALFCTCFFFIFGGSNCSISVKTGGSVTIPCYYDKKYTQQSKFWYSEKDKSRIYTNSTEGKVSVIDYPDESLFLVTMRDVKKTQSGRYIYCVEADEPTKNCIATEVHLDVQDAPDLSVVSRSVSADEGGHISVQCLYNTTFQRSSRLWCTYKDRSCYGVGRTGVIQNVSVQIRDDGSGSFTVMMSGLKLKDSGWYFCYVANLQVSVQLTVTPKSHSIITPTAAAVATDTSTEELWHMERFCLSQD